MFFTVIVAIYNAERTLKKCIDSILNQAYSDFEVLLIDDGSTDNSLEICNKLKITDVRIKVYHKSNGGPCSARNFGIKKSQGKYIVYVDADDTVDNDHLLEISKIIEDYNDIDMIVFNYRKICVDYYQDSGFNFLINTSKKKINKGFYNKKQMKKLLYPNIFFIGDFNLANWRVAYNRDLLLKHYCKNENIIYYEDYCYAYECLYNARSIYFLDKILYYYNKTNENSLTSVEKNSLDNVLIAYEYIFKKMHNKNNVIDAQLNDSFVFYINNALFKMCKNHKNNINFRPLRWNKYSKFIKKNYSKMLSHLLKTYVDPSKVKPNFKNIYNILRKESYMTYCLILWQQTKIINIKKRYCYISKKFWLFYNSIFHRH